MNKKENIKRLTKVQLIQYRSVFYIFIGCIFLLAIISALSIAAVHFQPQKNGVWDIYSGLGIQQMMLGALFCLSFGSYNLLSNDEISMFPGTVLSKYYSTVLVYHLMILAYVLSSVLLYLIIGVLLLLATNLWHELIPYGLFSWEYLWKGSLLLLARCLAVYGFGLLWYALIERFRAWIIYLAAGGCALLIVLLQIMGKAKAVFYLLAAYAGVRLSFASYLLLLFATWALCLLLSWILAQTVHSWKRADKKRLISNFIILQVGMFAAVFSQVFSYSYEYSFEVEKFQDLTDHRTSSLVDVSAFSKDERDAALLNGNLCWETPYRQRNCFLQSDANVLCSVSEAKEYGLDFEESGIDENHVMVLLGSQGLRYSGQDLGEKLIKACEDSVTLQYGEVLNDWEESPTDDYYYQVTLPDQPVIVLNETLGDLRKYLSNTTLGNNREWDVDSEGITGKLIKVVIYPDEWKSDFEED